MTTQTFDIQEINEDELAVVSGGVDGAALAGWVIANVFGLGFPYVIDRANGSPVTLGIVRS